MNITKQCAACLEIRLHRSVKSLCIGCGIALCLLSCSAPPDAPRVRVDSDELRPVVTEALGRWSVATGVSIRLGRPATIRVRLGEPTSGDGATIHDPNSDTYRVILREPDPEMAIHELGHALGAAGHVERGVLQTYKPYACITAADLEKLCQTLRCQSFNPECP